MGQSAHPGRAPVGAGSALAGVAGLVGALTLTGCGQSVAAAATVVRDVTRAVVVHADGSSVVAADGQRLRPGDVLRTAPGGAAELVTRDRVVYVESDAAVQVLDGERQQLRHGDVVVDAQHGPGLQLEVAGLDVDTPSGSAVRAERSVIVRIGTLAGAPVRIENGSGKALSVPALAQAMVGGDALPSSATVLRLTDDAAEAHAAPSLVRDDEALRSLATGIDSTGSTTARIVSAAWRGPVATPPPGLARSEIVLPVAIAKATPPAEASDAYRSAVQWRAAGGSWGVIAHRLRLGAPAIVDSLAALERMHGGGLVGTITGLLRGAQGATPALPTGPGGGNGPGGTVSPGGGGGPTTTASPSPSPTPSPTGSSDPVSSTVSQVLSVVPSPTPTTTATSPAAGGILTSPPALLQGQ